MAIKVEAIKKKPKIRNDEATHLSKLAQAINEISHTKQRLRYRLMLPSSIVLTSYLLS